MNAKRVGFCVCGSFCTFARVLPQMEKLVALGAEVTPILSETSYETDTRFGRAAEWIEKIEKACKRPIIHTLADAEPIGPRKLLDVLIVAPCTGNTLNKLAQGVTDTSVTMACKAHLRNGRPVVIAVSTNDGLGASAAGLGILLARRNIYFVPFGQDDAAGKPCSLVAHMEKIPETAAAALDGRQLQPLLVC